MGLDKFHRWRYDALVEMSDANFRVFEERNTESMKKLNAVMMMYMCMCRMCMLCRVQFGQLSENCLTA